MSKRKALGYGLSGLIGEEKITEKSIPNDNNQQEIYVTDITPNPYQPRQIFSEDEISELTESIKKSGVLQPILVRKKSDGKYELIAGERRWRASKKAGLNKIPAIIKKLEDQDVMVIALVENIQREDLSPLEEAEALENLIKATGKTKEEISKLISKSRSYVSNSLRLLTLPAFVKEMIRSNRLSSGHARTLVGLENAEEAAKLAIEKKLNVRQLENLIRNMKKPNTSIKNAENKPLSLVNADYDNEITAIEKSLSESLNMSVSLSLGGTKNMLSIKFTDMAQLDYLMEKLTK
jgi:ParB family chromosome partitioning protein